VRLAKKAFPFKSVWKAGRDWGERSVSFILVVMKDEAKCIALSSFDLSNSVFKDGPVIASRPQVRMDAGGEDHRATSWDR